MGYVSASCRPGAHRLGAWDNIATYQEREGYKDQPHVVTRAIKDMPRKLLAKKVGEDAGRDKPKVHKGRKRSMTTYTFRNTEGIVAALARPGCYAVCKALVLINQRIRPVLHDDASAQQNVNIYFCNTPKRVP
jgi:hypothetical protein